VTDERPDVDEPARGEKVSDDRIDALAEQLRNETTEDDVRVDVTEASEHIGTGTDR
jgi:hypothetical protein